MGWPCTKYVILGQTLHRLPVGFPASVPNFNDLVDDLNHYTFTQLQSIPCAKYWHHVGFHKSPELVWDPEDGVHPNDIGLYRLFRSVRGRLCMATGIYVVS